ncbi:MAG: OsmC family protein [Candidatus Helarchaeota archaeon]
MTWKENFLSEARIGKHKLLLDEDVVIGGTNNGPNPASLLLASIGGCEVATCLFWSKQLDVKIDALEVSITGTFDVRGLLGIGEVDSGYRKLKIAIKITSPDDKEKIEQLIKKVEKHCPVFNTILKTPELVLSHKISKQ